jgi:hypothetical protein
MSRIDLVVSSPIPSSSRARQLEGMFEVPRSETTSREWHGDIDLDSKPWNVGLILGPSGSGKSLCAKQLFGDFDSDIPWSGSSVIDDFPDKAPIGDIIEACQSVGFNTIPAWMRPYHVLSNGEKFRVDLARRLLSDANPIVIDEFTSVVDRQVAQIASHAIQKTIRRNNKRFVAVSCHFDIIDWLNPDWIFEPSTMKIQWRSLQQRPQLKGSIERVDWKAWKIFAPYHYMNADLHRAAKCFGLFMEGKITAFAGVLFRPISNAKNNPSAIYGVSRLVTLPDYQGMGLAFALTGKLGAAHKSLGHRFHTYPAHPSFIRAFQKSREWTMIKKTDTESHNKRGNKRQVGLFDGHRCAIFRYVGPAMDKAIAENLLN